MRVPARRVGLCLPALAAAILWPLALQADPDAAPTVPRPGIQVFKLPTCGCCRTWVKYLEAAGFPVTVTDTTGMFAIRDQHGVPPALAGCHTALIDGYLIEGHVSVAEIERLLTERPDIQGLLVPGMPKGSPGMEGPGAERYDVLALGKDGTVSVYASHEPPATDPAPTMPQAPDPQ